MAVINQQLATTYFGNEDPIGKRIRLTDDTPAGKQSAWATIVGLAPNVRQRGGMRSPDPDPVVYVPHQQNPTMASRHVASSCAAVPIRARSRRCFARRSSRSIPTCRWPTSARWIRTSAQQRWDVRVFGTMFTVFAGIAIILATVGLYAVTAYSVTQRTQEIGVRMALGAQAEQVRNLILRRGLIQLGYRSDHRLGGGLRCGEAAAKPAGANGADRPGDAGVHHAPPGGRWRHRLSLAGAAGDAAQPGHCAAI